MSPVNHPEFGGGLISALPRVLRNAVLKEWPLLAQLFKVRLPIAALAGSGYGPRANPLSTHVCVQCLCADAEKLHGVGRRKIFIAGRRVNAPDATAAIWG